MMKGNCWIHETAFENLIVEAQNKFPDETGGVFMGYQANYGKDLVVTHVIGPGPNAIHKPCGYIPDAIYHENEIAMVYSESKQLHTYLGDWHTHPHGKTLLSRKDRKALRGIAKHKEARISKPIMGILACSEPSEFSMWRYHERGFLFCGLPTHIEMNIRLYG